MNEILKRALLFDFYGELLTDHQKEIYGRFLLDDLSSAEIAKEAGISRQGVHDLIRRCTQTLDGYEEKLHLVERFALAKEKISEIERLTRLDEKEERENGHDRLCEVQERMERIRSLSRELLKEL